MYDLTDLIFEKYAEGKLSEDKMILLLEASDNDPDGINECEKKISEIQSKINDIAKSNKTTAESLQKRLNSIKSEYKPSEFKSQPQLPRQMLAALRTIENDINKIKENSDENGKLKKGNDGNFENKDLQQIQKLIKNLRMNIEYTKGTPKYDEFTNRLNEIKKYCTPHELLNNKGKAEEMRRKLYILDGDVRDNARANGRAYQS